MKVTSGIPGSPECSQAYSIGRPVLYEPLTKRPIFGQILVCRAMPSNFLPAVLQLIIHEFVHILVRD